MGYLYQTVFDYPEKQDEELHPILGEKVAAGQTTDDW